MKVLSADLSVFPRLATALAHGKAHRVVGTSAEDLATKLARLDGLSTKQEALLDLSNVVAESEPMPAAMAA